ncbi:MAG: hypothetical protein J6K41_09800, partial [Paraprevotella sp.]|nr:hypothetical protein [Paraprevotella sp.]
MAHVIYKLDKQRECRPASLMQQLFAKRRSKKTHLAPHRSFPVIGKCLNLGFRHPGFHQITDS